MNINETELRNNIRTILLAVSNEDMPDSDNRAWENREFKPTIGVPWLRETTMPGNERQYASNTLEGVGFMQYEFFWPIHTGTKEIEALVVDVKAAFKPATVLDAHSLIYRAERLTAIVGDNWYQIPVRLTWRAHAIG